MKRHNCGICSLRIAASLKTPSQSLTRSSACALCEFYGTIPGVMQARIRGLILSKSLAILSTVSFSYLGLAFLTCFYTYLILSSFSVFLHSSSYIPAFERRLIIRLTVLSLSDSLLLSLSLASPSDFGLPAGFGFLLS